MNKAAVVESLKLQLKTQLDRAIAAVESAAEGATGDDTKAESKYDTRGLESSYLAAGQAGQVEELARILGILENFEFADFSGGKPIDVGALVRLRFEGEDDWYLIAPGGGGLECEGVTIIGSQAPLTAKLLDKKTGESPEGSPMTIEEVQ